MSSQAQGERERQARIILSHAETRIVEKFSQAALTYQNNPVALHFRAMNMLFEAIKERGSMVIVPASVVETMGLGGMLATASLGGVKPQRKGKELLSRITEKIDHQGTKEFTRGLTCQRYR